MGWKVRHPARLAYRRETHIVEKQYARSSGIPHIPLRQTKRSALMHRKIIEELNIALFKGHAEADIKRCVPLVHSGAITPEDCGGASYSIRRIQYQRSNPKSTNRTRTSESV